MQFAIRSTFLKACDMSKLFWICGFLELVLFIAFNTENEPENRIHLSFITTTSYTIYS